MKVAILLPYFNRPRILRNALNSIRDTISKDWELHFIDDASPTTEGYDSVEEILSNDMDKVVRYRVSKEEKEECYWTTQPKYLNRAMRKSNADICIILCDDDALLPTYVGDIIEWFSNNDFIYGYSHVIPFDPSKELPNTAMIGRPHILNLHMHPIEPENKVDASQVVWRRGEAVKAECFFPEYRNEDLDSRFYRVMYRAFGPCPFMGFYGQYKGFHPHQLGHFKLEHNFDIPRE